MKTIDISEILNLYEKCNVDTNGNGVIRNTINSRALNNKLNTGNSFDNNIPQNSVWTNNTLKFPNK